MKECKYDRSELKVNEITPITSEWAGFAPSVSNIRYAVFEFINCVPCQRKFSKAEKTFRYQLFNIFLHVK